MTAEVWFRNPYNYIRELVEAGEYHVAWDRGVLVRQRIDPVKHASLYFGEAYPWRILAIGEQGTAEYRKGDDIYTPTAVYPTWVYGEQQSLLEELVEQPVGNDIGICTDKSVAGDERPVLGQEHRVVITNIPNITSGPGRHFLTFLRTLQEDNPECIFHLHGLYSYRAMFGLGFRSSDVDPRSGAAKGKVTMPSGKEVVYERSMQWPDWTRMLGYKPTDLKVPRNRTIFNIRSAVWASKNFTELTAAPTKNTGAAVDTSTPDASHKAISVGSPLPVSVKGQPGDKFHCDTCSLQDQCKYFRTGAVCSVPGAEPKELAFFFKTRDSERIIDGLGTLVAANARRLERGMAEESAMGDLDPEVSKILNQVFEQGTKLAKLLDPNLRGGTKVQVNVGANGQAAVAIGNPRQMVSAAIRELESQGIARADITPQMIQGLLEGMVNPEQAQRTFDGHRDHRVIEQ